MSYLEYLRKHYEETKDSAVKEELQKLIDAEEDTAAILQLIGRLKSEGAKKSVRTALLSWLGNDVARLRIETEEFEMNGPVAPMLECIHLNDPNDE